MVSLAVWSAVVSGCVSVVEHCKKPLDDYLATHFDGKVKAVHQAQREGLIRTRLAGAKVATGQVLIFLDSHVEANINWLPPLLGLLHCPLFCISRFTDTHLLLVTTFDSLLDAAVIVCTISF